MSILTFSMFAAVLFTSLLSGVLGMGGGVLLAGFLAAIFPLTTALVVHATAQWVANTYRAWLSRKFIVWSVIGPYSAGLLLISGIFMLFSVSFEKPMFYLLLGLIALSGQWLPKNLSLDILRRSHSVTAGFLVGGLHLFVGVSGPLLDLFFQRTQLTRFQIVATKAMTQSLGHGARLLFYSAFLSDQMHQSDLALDLLVWVGLTAMLGTYLGRHLLVKISELQFQSFTRWLLVFLGGIYIVKGVLLLLM